MNHKKIFNYYLVFFVKIIFLLILVANSKNFAVYFQPHLLSETLSNFTLASFLHPLTYHDGLHYLSIASNGYYTYEQAFFPFWPLILSMFSYFGKYLAFMTLVLNQILLYFLLGNISIFVNSLQKNNELFRISKIGLVLLTLPSSFVLQTAYNETLYLLLIFYLLNLFLDEKNKVFSIFLVSVAIATTRVTGILLIPAFLILLPIYSLRKKILSMFAGAITGLSAYMTYLQITTHDPLFFLHSQSYFGANRSDKIVLLPQVLWRYVKIFWTATIDRAYIVAISEFLSLFLGILGILIFFRSIKNMPNQNTKKIIISLGIYSALALLLPASSGTLSSMPRYLLSAPATWLGLAFVKNNYIWISILILLLVWQIVAFIFFGNGYFVF